MSEEAAKENTTDTLPSPANETGRSAEENPWTSIGGSFKDEPFCSMMDEVREHIHENRRKMDIDDQRGTGEDSSARGIDMSEQESKDELAVNGISSAARIGKDHPLAGVVGSFGDEASQSWLDKVMEHIREQRRLDREAAEEESRVSS